MAVIFSFFFQHHLNWTISRQDVNDADRRIVYEQLKHVFCRIGHCHTATGCNLGEIVLIWDLRDYNTFNSHTVLWLSLPNIPNISNTFNSANYQAVYWHRALETVMRCVGFPALGLRNAALDSAATTADGLVKSSSGLNSLGIFSYFFFIRFTSFLTAARCVLWLDWSGI